MSSKKKTVSEQLNDLINPTPKHFDPEEDIHTETSARVVDNDYEEDFSDDEGLSRFRKENAELIEETDHRYIGKKVSRKTVRSQDSSEDDVSPMDEKLSDEDTPFNMGSDQKAESGDNMSEDDEGKDDEDDDDGDEGEDEDSEDNEDYSISQPESKDDSFQHLTHAKDGEVEKGLAIRNQLGLWDQLLEVRIRLQKCLALANRMPQSDTLPTFRREGGADFSSLANQAKQSASNLLKKLLELRDKRFKSFSETRDICRGKKRSRSQSENDEEITSSEDEDGDDVRQDEEEQKPKLKKIRPSDYTVVLAEQHSDFAAYRDATIQKWNDKTRTAVGNVSSRNFSAFEQSTLRQIEQILANRPRLIARTQIKRSTYKVLGKVPSIVVEEKNEESKDENKDVETPTTLEDKTKEQDPEIFDDDDFYHQLLRELIERKAVDVTDPVQLGRQWLELQKIRSKMKRKVDIRATKGRKLRYTVHPKLVSFMAPESYGDWTEEAKTDLYNSLFGKST